MIKQQIYIFFYFLLTFVTIACQESNNVSDTGWINGLKAYLEFLMEGGSEYCSFSLQNGLDASYWNAMFRQKMQVGVRHLCKEVS